MTSPLLTKLTLVFFSVSAIEPGLVGTQFASTAFAQEAAPKDETTKALYDKMMGYMMSNWMAEGVVQTGDDCAEYILRAITDEKTQLHYFTNKNFEATKKIKFHDMTGEESLRESMKYLS
jgi:hypothetical protein